MCCVCLINVKGESGTKKHCNVTKLYNPTSYVKIYYSKTATIVATTTDRDFARIRLLRICLVV